MSLTVVNGSMHSINIKMRNEIKYLHNRFSCKLMLLDILVIGFGRDRERERKRERVYANTYT